MSSWAMAEELGILEPLRQAQRNMGAAFPGEAIELRVESIPDEDACFLSMVVTTRAEIEHALDQLAVLNAAWREPTPDNVVVIFTADFAAPLAMEPPMTDEPHDPPPAGFVRPFRYDGIAYILDANNEMAADFHYTTGAIRARGWGRIQYQPDADVWMELWSAWLHLRAAGSTDPELIVMRLNSALVGGT